MVKDPMVWKKAVIYVIFWLIKLLLIPIGIGVIFGNQIGTLSVFIIFTIQLIVIFRKTFYNGYIKGFTEGSKKIEQHLEKDDVFNDELLKAVFGEFILEIAEEAALFPVKTKARTKPPVEVYDTYYKIVLSEGYNIALLKYLSTDHAKLARDPKKGFKHAMISRGYKPKPKG